MITAQKVFTVITCYATLRSVLTIHIPIGIAQIAEAKASCDRIVKLLREPVLKEKQYDGINVEKIPAIRMSNISVALNSTTTFFDHLYLILGRGLIGLTGPLGSGKSTLLKTILNDLKIVTGDVEVSIRNFI